MEERRRGRGDGSAGASRREVLALGAALPLLRAPQRGPRWPLERAPDLRDERVLRHVVGLRPYGRGGIRLARDRVGDRVLVHDYGHGGCGVTLSWGSALESLDLAGDALARADAALVLGAGAVGLATALLLLERGVAVRVRAAALPPDTTSDVAGALWLPTGVDAGTTPEERARFDRVARRSWERFEALAGEGLGVARRRVYDANATSPRDRRLRAIRGPIAPLERLPLPGPPRRGVRYDSWLIEPPVYLRALLERVCDGGGAVEQGRVESPEELAEAPEPLVFNCTGLGSRELLGDRALLPVRGQLVHLDPQALGYLYCDGSRYLFPRADAVVVGGTFERGAERRSADPGTGRRLLARMRERFGVA